MSERHLAVGPGNNMFAPVQSLHFIGIGGTAMASVAAAQEIVAFKPFGSIEPDARSDRTLGDPLAVLGHRLFFDARLSGTGRTACASCSLKKSARKSAPASTNSTAVKGCPVSKSMRK